MLTSARIRTEAFQASRRWQRLAAFRIRAGRLAGRVAVIVHLLAGGAARGYKRPSISRGHFPEQRRPSSQVGRRSHFQAVGPPFGVGSGPRKAFVYQRDLDWPWVVLSHWLGSTSYVVIEPPRGLVYH